MSSFFKTQEFTFMKRLRDRLIELNTKNNYDKYRKTLAECKVIAKRDYNNIGWREDENEFAWAKFDESNFAPEMISFGGYEEMSPIHDEVMFMTEDHKQMAFKDSKNRVFRYSESETNEMRGLSIQEFQDVHEIKKNFEGEVVSDE